MAHPTLEGLTLEESSLCILATKHLDDLSKRGVTAEYLTAYAAKASAMQDADSAHTGMTSDKEQLTAREQIAKSDLLIDVRKMQGGAKRTFDAGSPQLEEFYVGERYNRSAGVLCKWAGGIAKAWEKYKADLIAKGNLVQEDVDTMVANAAILGNANATQENAVHVDSPEATTAAQKAMDDVEATADFIYGAARAAYAKNAQLLGEFEAIKPLRYSAEKRPPKGPTPPPTNPPKN